MKRRRLWSRTFDAAVLLSAGCASFDASTTSSPDGGSGPDGGATSDGGSASDGSSASDAARPADAYAAAVLADLPLAYWRLTEANGATTLASAVSTHSLVVTNAPALAAGGLFGGAGGAVGFDGKAGRRLVASTLPSVFQSGRFAFETWLFLANPPDDTARYVALASDGTRELAVFVRVATLTVDVSDNGNRAFINHAAPATGVWHHLVVQADGLAEPRLWFDGVESSPGGTRAAGAGAQRSLTIGASGDGDPSLGPDAKVAEIAVYDHVLANDRVLEHYELGTKP